MAIAKQMDRAETIERLKELRNFKVGDRPPEWLPLTGWGPAISELAGAAVAVASDTIGGRPFTLAGLLCRARLAEAIRQI